MKAVSQTYHLSRRNGVWSYRRRVPTPLVQAFGKKVIQFSLDTSDLKEAKKRPTAEDLKWTTRFEAAENGVLVGLDRDDIADVPQGLIVTLKRSKTDQDGVGRKIGVPHGRTRHCPVAAIAEWLVRTGITDGAVFRPIDRHSHVHPERLSGEAVSLVVKHRVQAAGMNSTGYSGHSLRAGFATSAAQAGVPTGKIRAQTGHASDAMLARYIRDDELFMSNAAGSLL